MKMDKKISPSSNSTTVSIQQINNLLKSNALKSNNTPSSQNEFKSSSTRRSPSMREVRSSIYLFQFTVVVKFLCSLCRYVNEPKYNI